MGAVGNSFFEFFTASIGLVMTPSSRARAASGTRSDRGRAGVTALAHAVALALGRDHGRVMREPIEQRGRQLLVAGEDRHPFGKREIGRDDCGPSFIPIRDQIEEQFAADPVKRGEPDSSTMRTSTRSSRCCSRVSSRVSRASTN